MKSAGKTVITIDLNPMSRTAIHSDVTIVDNIVRALPLMVKYAQQMNGMAKETLLSTMSGFDNRKNLSEAVSLMMNHLERKAREGLE